MEGMMEKSGEREEQEVNCEERKEEGRVGLAHHVLVPYVEQEISL